MWNYLILPACYLLGALPVGCVVCRLWKQVDILQEGSGNPGFANVFRVCGAGPGVTVLVLDVLKGLLAVLGCRRAFLFPQEVPFGAWGVVLGGLLAIVGHNWSIFLGFRGGKGVATSLGVIIGLVPASALIGFLLWGVAVLITQYSSLGSLLGALSIPLTMWAFHSPPPFLAFGGLATAFVIVRHISNIQRLLNGTERKLFTPPWGKPGEREGEEGPRSPANT
jgi:glycerol-3-phosphate acyltransferase PlsY